MAAKKGAAKRDQQRRQRRAQQEKARAADRGDRRARSLEEGLEEQAPLRPRLTPPMPERLMPPVHVDASGQVVPDPWLLLGLRQAESDPAVIRAACRDRLLEHPPEQAPEVARQVLAARDRLLDPGRWRERELGALQVPDASRWELPDLPPPGPPRHLDVGARLAGQAVLYALVEDALDLGGPPTKPGQQRLL